MLNSALSRGDEQSELLTLIDDFIHDQLRPADAQRLQACLLSSQSARMLYLEYLDLHSELLQLGGTAHLVELDLLPPPTASRPLSQFSWGKMAVVCVLTLIVGTVCFFLTPQAPQPGPIEDIAAAVPVPPPEPVEPVESAVVIPIVARLRLSDLVTGSLLNGQALTDNLEIHSSDELVLKQGAAEIRFASGASAFLVSHNAENTIHLIIHSDRSCELKSGSGYFRVPAEAIGFAVITSGGKVVDLGTEFGVALNATGEAEVHVTDGMVEASSHIDQQPVQLPFRTAAKIAQSGRAPGIIPFSADRFQPAMAYAEGVRDVTGQLYFHPTPLQSLSEGELNFRGAARLFAERAAVELKQPLTLTAEGLEWEGEHPPVESEEFRLQTGTTVDSYYLEYKSRPDDPLPIRRGSVEFQRPILAIAYLSKDINFTQPLFSPLEQHLRIRPGTGVELDGTLHRDRLRLSADRKTLHFELAAFKGASDAVRILTESVPASNLDP